MILGRKNSLADEDEGRQIVNGSAGRQIAIEGLIFGHLNGLAGRDRACEYVGRCASPVPGLPTAILPRAQPLRPHRPRSSVEGLSPTSKSVVALFMRREEKLSKEQKEYLGRLCDADEALADARRLTQEFAGMGRELEGTKLNGWLEEAEASGSMVMRRFAAGLKKDFPAGPGGPYGGVEQRAGGGLRPQAQAVEATGLRAGGVRPAESKDAGCVKPPLPERSSGGLAVSPRSRQNPLLVS